MDPYSQNYQYLAFDADHLVEGLGVVEPPLSRTKTDPLKQLRYLGWYLADPVMGCRSVVIEDHYIDRDHMEDHAVFYSRTLYPYPNYCRRAHFFRAPVAEVQAAIGKLQDALHSTELHTFKGLCRQFSQEAYLGFAVIKPLRGSPVGRTVLRSFPERKDGRPDYRRAFECTREYTVHVDGIELYVTGLPFQQQDKAVAACATTALWSALHRAREFEDIAPFTPAQITALSAQRSLAFGRAMPSEGLSLDQMCQAVQAVGVSPVLRRIEEFRSARGLLYSSILSGVAPVLIISQGRMLSHAVVAVGMGVRTWAGQPENDVRDLADSLEVLYIHDDRIGPYLRASLYSTATSKELKFDITFGRGARQGKETWTLTHVLFPMHAKVRITFGELRELAFDQIAAEVKAYIASVVLPRGDTGTAEPLEVSSWILRSYRYLRGLLRAESAFDRRIAISLGRTVALPRYAGIVRLKADWMKAVDVVIDTTSTDKNVYAVAVVPSSLEHELTAEIARHLADQFGCKLVEP